MAKNDFCNFIFTFGANPYCGRKEIQRSIEIRSNIEDALVISMKKITHFVCITADGCNAFNPEVKRFDWKAGLLKERHDEAAQAAIDMKSDIVLLRQLAQCDDIVLTAIWEIDC